MALTYQEFPNFRSINSKLLFAVMGVSTLMTSLVVFLNFYFEYSNDLSLLEERVAQIEKTTVPTISNAIWNLDEQYLKLQLEGVLKIEDIVLTRVLDNHGNLIIEKGSNLNTKNDIIKREFYLYSDQVYTQEYLGKLQLFITKDYIVEKIKKKFLIFMSSQLIKTFLLAWIILMIFHRFISKNLEQIINFTRTFDLDSNFLNKLNIRRKDHVTDEIHILEFEINRMLEKIYVLNQLKDQTISDQEKELQIQRALEINSARLNSLYEMLGGLSHEINNPMTVISYSARKIQDLLKDDQLDKEKIQFFAKRIQESGSRIKNVLHSVQMTSRTPDDDPFEVLTVNDLILGVSETLNAETSLYGIEFSISFLQNSTKDLLIKVKRVAIYQVLQNLVKNAVEASKTVSSPSIQIDIFSDDGQLFINVVDNGKGISPTLQEKIFDPFYTTKEIGKGTGLGLTIASRLVEANNGTLTLISESKYTTFQIKLPLYK